MQLPLPVLHAQEVFGRDHVFLPRAEILSFEEITRVVGAAATLGVTKVRLTGGEPLVRRDLERLVAMLAAVEGISDLALTTNGTLLAAKARPLQAGLSRVTVSLDSLDEDVFRAMNDMGVPLARVLEGIAAAQKAGFSPVKLNTVVKRGVNDHGLVDLARFARAGALVCRLEYMDVGTTRRRWTSCPPPRSSAHRRRGPWSRSGRTIGARSPTAIATATGRGRSA